MKKIIIMISDRGSNMLAIAENVKTGNLIDVCKITYVFSNNLEAVGLQKAAELGIPTNAITSKGKKKKNYNAKLLSWLRRENPDFIILAGYMKLLSPEIIREFHKRIINIHPADTSLHQGLHGYDWAWENKLQDTKITVHYVDEGLDTGKVIGKKVVNISDCKTIEEVEQVGLKIEHKFYSECIFKILTAKDGKAQRINANIE